MLIVCVGVIVCVMVIECIRVMMCVRVIVGGDECEARDLKTGIIAKGQDTVVNNSSKGIGSPVHEAINGENLNSNSCRGVNSALNSNCKTQAI